MNESTVSIPYDTAPNLFTLAYGWWRNLESKNETKIHHRSLVVRLWNLSKYVDTSITIEISK